MSVHVILNLLNELRKRCNLYGYAKHFISFHSQGVNKFNNTGAHILDSTKLLLNISFFGLKTSLFAIYT